MNGEKDIQRNISVEAAIDLARAQIANLDYVDARNVIRTHLAKRVDALAAGVPDGPGIRDRWLVDFARIETGHVTDGMFDSLTVSVDAETGKAQIQESF